MKHLRPNAGIGDLPNGPEMYQGFLEFYTSKINITPGKSTEHKNVSLDFHVTFMHTIWVLILLTLEFK